MRHRNSGVILDRKASARGALFYGLLRDFVLHGSITTTVAKAKELRSRMEKVITKSKINSLHTRRFLLSQFRHHDDVVEKLLNEIGPKYQSRHGGYTRITRLGRRVGDGGEQAKITFVE